MAKLFAWSWSRLKNYRDCPKRHYELDIAKNYPDDSEAIRWGHEFHAAMSKTIDTGKPLPVTMERHAHLPTFIRRRKEEGADIRTEVKLAMSRDFKPTHWFDPLTWFRGVADVLMIGEHLRKALVIDWKTGGKIRNEGEQLQLNAQLVFTNFDEVDEVNTMYHWTQHLDAEPVINTYQRDGMMPMWNRLLPEVKQMEEAHRTLTYPPKPGALCISWCPVTSCPYHGIGTRHGTRMPLQSNATGVQ